VLFKMSDSAKYSLLSQVIWSMRKQSRANKIVVWIFFLRCICMCFHWMLKATKAILQREQLGKKLYLVWALKFNSVSYSSSALKLYWSKIWKYWD
jgi:hypothetical protein